jgi:IMP dehydrogenase
MIKALSFDDVLIVPKYSNIQKRGDVNLSTTLCGHRFETPILSANMSSVTEVKMAIAMIQENGLPILHRMCSPDEQLHMISDIFLTLGSKYTQVIGFAIEGTSEGINRADKIFNNFPYSFKGQNLIPCIDVAHAACDTVVQTVKEFNTTWKNYPLIVGNFATPEGVQYVYEKTPPNYRMAFKIGIGSGSQCSTRIVTGCGLPTFESLRRIKENWPASEDYDIIADGGFKNSGDIVKALAMGAKAVMLGSLLAGTDQAPGSVIVDQGKKYKVYRGSASFGQKFEFVPSSGVKYIEGTETLVPYKGDATDILRQLLEGVRSGCSYVGAQTLRELKSNAEFVELTANGFQESKPHGSF